MNVYLTMTTKKPKLWFEDEAPKYEDDDQEMEEREFESADGMFNNPLGNILRFPDFKINQIPVKLGETEDRLLLRAEMPGFSKKDIKLKVTPNLVFLSAQKKAKKVGRGEGFFKSETSSSSTSRILQLPKQVKTDGVRARFKDGFLEVVLKKVKDE